MCLKIIYIFFHILFVFDMIRNLNFFLLGLDLREFDDAITFKVALMVKKYLTSRGIEA